MALRRGVTDSSLSAQRRAPSGQEAARSVAVMAALRAASLLSGGVPSAKVWRVLGEEPGAADELAAIAARIAAGQASEMALADGGGPEWRVLAAAWSLAQHSGAPIARMLERIAEALGSLERIGHRRSVLLAGPRATIRLVCALPPIALLFGAVLGFDPLAVMLSPAGAVLGALGGALLLAGARWAKLLTDRLAASDDVSGLECELCWIALSGGASQQMALRGVADRADMFGAEWVRLGALGRDGSVQQVFRAATAHGTPAGPMLLAEAAAERARTLAELEQRAERLAVSVLLPIGVCVLPSFIVLGVLPVLLAVMGSLDPLV